MRRMNLAAEVLSIGFLSLASAMAGSPQTQFDSVFGDEAKKVAATPDKRDDVAFAEKLLAAATKANDDLPFQTILCEKAVEFGTKHADGYAAAEDALRLLGQVAPDRLAECQGKMLDLCEQRFKLAKPDAKATAMRKLVNLLVSLGEADLAGGRVADAAARFKRAAALAKQAKSADAADLAGKADRAAALEAANAQAETLAKALAEKPDPAGARKLLMLHLAERDDPAKAAELLAAADADESLRSYLPLAVKTWMELSDAQCMELGRWYEHLATQAGALGRGRMLQRAKAYFDACATLHGKQDATATQARQSAERVGKLLDKAGGPQAGGFEGPPEGLSAELIPWFKERDALPAKDQGEAVRKKLSEVNGNAEIVLRINDVKADRLVGLFFNGCKSLKSIGPLYGMKLRSLDLSETGVSSLRVLRGMKLDLLALWGCQSLSSLEGLEGMPLVEFSASQTSLPSLKLLRGAKLKRIAISRDGKLTSLEGLEGMPLVDAEFTMCNNLSSIEPLRGAPLTRLYLLCPTAVGHQVLAGMPLRDLILSNSSVAMRSLEPLRGLKLAKLALRASPGVTDLAPLAGMPLEELDLSATKVTSLLPLRGMPLRVLDVRGCSALQSLDGIDRLPLATLRLGDTKFANEKTAGELKKRIPTLTTVDIVTK